MFYTLLQFQCVRWEAWAWGDCCTQGWLWLHQVCWPRCPPVLPLQWAAGPWAWNIRQRWSDVHRCPGGKSGTMSSPSVYYEKRKLLFVFELMYRAESFDLLSTSCLSVSFIACKPSLAGHHKPVPEPTECHPHSPCKLWYSQVWSTSHRGSSGTSEFSASFATKPPSKMF